MNNKTRALFEACYPIARVANVVDALPQRSPDDTPLAEVVPGIWPTLGDVRKLRDAMVALGWKS